MNTNMMRIIGSVIVLIIGLTFSEEVINAMVAAGGATGVGSAIGFDIVNRVMPVLYLVFLIGLTFVGAGGLGIVGAVGSARGRGRRR